ncbi:MAG: dTDP-4-dehydrorhamnose reductase [Acidobacteria bacterium]|nr:dTDP-4-dehydrorhamnose reductase [Acidobacteriota bacterium]
MRVLVTGSGGQLGQALLEELNAHELIPLTHSDLDVTRFSEVREAVSTYRPEIVINAAAYTNVDGAETERERAYRVNAGGPGNLAAATAELQTPLLTISSDYVFDGLAGMPYHEFDRTNPLSVYGSSKLAGEETVAALNPRHYIVRTAWLYHIIGRNFPRTMLAQADRAKVQVVNDQHGSPTYAPHLARAVSRLIDTGAYGTYHLAGSGAASWFEMTKRLYKLMEIGTDVIPVTTSEYPRPAHRPPFSVLTTIQNPEILLPHWEEGLAEFTRNIR